MDIEIWRDIPDYEGIYQVSNFGRVKSLNYLRSGKERILKPSNNGRGYLILKLYNNGKKKNFKIHKLVALAFLENDNPTEKTQVNHLDENKENNHVDNLCWCSHIENCNHATRNERVSKKLKGRKHTNETKQKMREAQKGKPRLYQYKPILQFTKDMIFVREWNSITTASEELNIDNSSITKCCKGLYKTCGEFIWKYKENNTDLVIS